VVVAPGTTEATRFVLVICKSAVGVNASLSVAALLPGVGSVTPAGGVTVAVLTNVPVAQGLTAPVTTYVTVLPTGRFTAASLTLPLPLAVKPDAPPVWVAV